MSIVDSARKAKVDKERQKELKTLASNFSYFARNLDQMDEVETLKLLHLERQGKNREQLVRRIYGRYNTLRKARELEELEVA